MKTKIKPNILWAAFLFGGFFVFACYTENAYSASDKDVVINEIAWMGTTTSTYDEWIELYNNTGSDIDLTNWTLKALDGAPEITLTGTISANSYFLLERTDDTSVPSVDANQIYAGTLGNSGENLELRDSDNNLIDSVNCSDDWFAGDNSDSDNRKTMERKNSQTAGSEASNWQTSQSTGGTPAAETSSGEEEEEEEE